MTQSPLEGFSVYNIPLTTASEKGTIAITANKVTFPDQGDVEGDKECNADILNVIVK